MIGATKVARNLKRSAQRVSTVAEKKMREAVRMLTAYIKTRKIPGKGNKTLRNRLKGTVRGGDKEVVGQIGTKLRAGILREKGGTLAARTIRPKNKKALAFEIKGQTIICSIVHQEAKEIKPDPFLQPALNENRARIIQMMGEVFAEVK